MNEGMIQEQRRGQDGALVISGDNEDWNAVICEAYEATVRHIHDARGYSASEKEIASVNHEVGFRIDAVIQDALIVVEEITPTSSPRRSTSERIVEAEMSIGEEDDPNVSLVHRGSQHRR